MTATRSNTGAASSSRAPVAATAAGDSGAAGECELPPPQAVEAFLRAYPDFLADRPDLYRVLDPPRRVHGERLADHMAAMLSAERRRVRGLEAEIDAAVSAERAGHGLTIRVRLAVLALMRCGDVPEAVTQEMPALLRHRDLHPPERGARPARRGAAAARRRARLLRPGLDAAVRPAPLDAELIHQEAAPLVKRDALVRVPVWTEEPTLLALGARDPNALPARQSTATLAFLGRAVAAALAR